MFYTTLHNITYNEQWTSGRQQQHSAIGEYVFHYLHQKDIFYSHIEYGLGYNFYRHWNEDNKIMANSKPEHLKVLK